MSYFFRKIKIIFKKNFSAHFLQEKKMDIFFSPFFTRKNPTSKWTFFSKKKLKFDFLSVFTSV